MLPLPFPRGGCEKEAVGRGSGLGGCCRMCWRLEQVWKRGQSGLAVGASRRKGVFCPGTAAFAIPVLPVALGFCQHL